MLIVWCFLRIVFVCRYWVLIKFCWGFRLLFDCLVICLLILCFLLWLVWFVFILKVLIVMMLMVLCFLWILIFFLLKYFCWLLMVGLLFSCLLIISFLGVFWMICNVIILWLKSVLFCKDFCYSLFSFVVMFLF